MADAPPTDDHTQDAGYGEVLDRAARALIAQATQGLAPSTLLAAIADWQIHLASAPGKQSELVEQAAKAALRLATTAMGVTTAPPLATDRRFRSPLWNNPPFSLLRDNFLLTEAWWHSATTGLRGMSPANEAALGFAVRQTLDIFSPTNSPTLNPEVLVRTREARGMNFVQGAVNLLDDMAQAASDAPDPRPEFRIGQGLAATPGKVVLRTRLIELIQYSPTTETVHPEPVLIVSAWIMKYYILDLSAQNSLVRWLVAQGHTVFMISWLNPDADDRDLGMTDYLDLGPRAALEAVQAITGADRVHAAGYCLGGTLLAILAADLAAAGDSRLATITLLAAQVDFSEAGELALFISEAQVALLEDMMWQRGYLDSKQMAGAFTLLRSNDLIWSRLVHEAMMGERADPTDLMVWNADATRMPYKMHSEYLRGLFLENRLSHGKYKIAGRNLSLTDIRLPILAVGTESDHVAPWASVFKIHHLTEADVTFILTSGGHNAGIVSEPGHPHRHYRIATTPNDAHFQTPEAWFAAQEPVEGSWWPAWSDWLHQRSGPMAPPPPMGCAAFPVLCDAPGSYVLQR